MEVVGMEYDWKNNSLIMISASKAIPIAFSHSLVILSCGKILERNFIQLQI
jgi:hypothetical protein